MIQLSYSTVNMLHTASHNWLNKQMGLRPEDKWYFKEGKVAHKILQEHISGTKRHMLLSTFKDFDNLIYPIVEKVDFDPDCKLEKRLDTVYNLIGFVDARTEDWKKILEIKTSSKTWSLLDFKHSMQRKVYCYAHPEIEVATLITCPRKQEEWNENNVKIFIVPTSKKDAEEAKEWIDQGIKIIESGDFTGGLNENGVCVDPYCYYGVNCQFK